MEEGIYTIINVATQKALTYPHGGKSCPVSVICCDLSKDYTSDLSRRQKWLVARHPDSELDAWQIFSLPLGFVLGVFSYARRKARSKGDEVVRAEAAPAALSDKATRWKIRGQSGKFELQWLEGESSARALTVDHLHRKTTVSICAIDDEPDQLWHFIPDKHLSLDGDFASWMSNVNDKQYLSQLSIPSTHQSIALARRWVESPRCQERSIIEQLNDGIRKFDLRFGIYQHDNDESCLFARHGSLVLGFFGAYMDEYVCLASVLQMMIVFLRKNPSEVVIATVSNEDRCDRFYDTFLHDIESVAERHFYKFDHGDTFSTINLGNLRGKIILKRADRGFGTDWDSKELPRDGLYYGQRNWTNDLTPGNRHALVATESPTPYKSIRANIEAAVEDHNMHQTYSHTWAAAHLPFVKNPIDYAVEAKQHIVHSQCYAAENIGAGGSRARLGEVLLDFYHLMLNECVVPVIRSNDGCGAISLNSSH